MQRCCDFYDFEPDNHAQLCPIFRAEQKEEKKKEEAVPDWVRELWQPTPPPDEADTDGSGFITLKEEKEWIRIHGHTPRD